LVFTACRILPTPTDRPRAGAPHPRLKANVLARRSHSTAATPREKTSHPRTAPWPTSLMLSALEVSDLRRHVAAGHNQSRLPRTGRQTTCRGDRTRRACRAQLRVRYAPEPTRSGRKASTVPRTARSAENQRKSSESARIPREIARTFLRPKWLRSARTVNATFTTSGSQSRGFTRNVQSQRVLTESLTRVRNLHRSSEGVSRC
jgi:hypothetical protein